MWISSCSVSSRDSAASIPAATTHSASSLNGVLPASSVANLYPFNYSGKLDSKGFYIGKDKYGSNILVDFDQRDEDKTSANILILGNSGPGQVLPDEAADPESAGVRQVRHQSGRRT